NLTDQLTLLQEFQALTSTAPLSWNSSLGTAATSHNSKMVSFGYQSHQYPLEASLASRTNAAGYTNGTRVTENLYGYAQTPFHAHSAMVIDWGNPSADHRMNLLDQNVREVGLSWMADNSITTTTGPYVLTQNFGNRSNYGNPYLVGSIFNDLDGNGRYEAGEGLSGVSVTVKGNGNTYNTSTLTAGGFQIQVPAGTYTVTVTGGGYYGKSELEVTVGSANREVDFISGYAGGFVDFELVSPPIDQIGVVRFGNYYLDGNGNRVWDTSSMADSYFNFGNADDQTVIGDWNGDGFDDVGVFRRGTWYLDMNGNGIWDGTGGGDRTTLFGQSGDTPIAGDWDGDGIDDIGVVRLGQWYLDMNGDGVWDRLIDSTIGFGAIGDTPLVGDWDGNGVDDFGVRRGRTWYLDMNSNRFWDGIDAGGDVVYNYGNPTDTPITGDWYGDGKDRIGIVRLGVWYLDQNGNGVWNGAAVGDALITYGISSDTPIRGKWNSIKTKGTGTYVGILSDGTGVSVPAMAETVDLTQVDEEALMQLFSSENIVDSNTEMTNAESVPLANQVSNRLSHKRSRKNSGEAETSSMNHAHTKKGKISKTSNTSAEEEGLAVKSHVSVTLG
ncbi:MAG: carboxypeptidase regulatory-like domain-containing protein, partial [Planctomycetaceae bacterium]|nr:carboxypeptidase regulatory-like domain-containing protein [Planctomycetaceae bacterium]